jgi:hypothetical protein
MPPPGGIAGPAAGFFGNSATMASVVIKSAAIEAAFWIATRTTLVGSMMPLGPRSGLLKGGAVPFQKTSVDVFSSLRGVNGCTFARC